MSNHDDAPSTVVSTPGAARTRGTSVRLRRQSPFFGFTISLGSVVVRLELADRANLLLIAPATANIIAELAHGLASHPLAAIALATRAQILLAPAMNGKMWEHPATKENVEKLKTRGVEFIGPEEGMLACGYEGIGRLWKVDDIAFRAEFLLARQDNLIA